MNKILLIGSGWRARMWARLVGALPEVELAGVLCRNAQKRAPFDAAGISVYTTYEQALAVSADAVLVCVGKRDNLSVSRLCRGHGYRVLCETPAGMSPSECAAFAESDVCIAEQYPQQPVFAAARAIVERGLLGEVHTLKLSCCHAYHAVAVMRALLGTGECIPNVCADTFADRYVVYADRGGEHAPQVAENSRLAAYLDFGTKHVFYDWSYGQYFSLVRGTHFLLQGTQGELSEHGGVSFSGGSALPFVMHRIYDGRDGSLFAPDLAAIACMGERVYENPFRGLRLSEEEIAMAHCLRDFLSGHGYSAREGALDALIAYRMEEAAHGTL